MKRQITASKIGPYGNNISINVSKADMLADALRQAYDALEEMDDETFQAVDGEAMMNDIDDYLREVSSVIEWYDSLLD